ncbi:hypothetical protein PR202_ga08365 [Eleusine coracana subsp. coracana]|uniref:MSP domain-containing protein n=1 Tax=Eleusine coracana subsp. coracana TaxID=191504 RepID=A0AAV5C180_ELECO|nr:hypothetical protein PR202_ga08365 [Eleusine coracana subsp. coracana]
MLLSDPPAAMGQDLVEIHPRELQFTFEVKKQSSCTVHLVNKSNEYVAFKVNNFDYKHKLFPVFGSSLSPVMLNRMITLKQHHLKDIVFDQIPELSFLGRHVTSQTTVVPYGTSDEDLIPAFFSKETGRYIEESKLRVVLVSAPDPLEEQPVNGFHSTEPAIEVSVPKEMPNIENEVLAVPKEGLHPLEQTPVVVTKIPLPVKEAQGLRDTLVPIEETPVLREIPVPINETPSLREVPVPQNGSPAVLTESPSPKQDAPDITFDHAPAITIDHAPAITMDHASDITINHAPATTIDHAPAITIDHAPAITIDPLPPLKQNTAAFKESPPEEAIMLSDRGLFNVQNHQLSHVSSFCY